MSKTNESQKFSKKQTPHVHRNSYFRHAKNKEKLQEPPFNEDLLLNKKHQK
jgi:hypothetical protein